MSKEQTIQRLQGFIQIYEQGFQSPLIDSTISKLLDTERERTEHESTTLRQRLAQYEQQYQMESSDFYRRFQAGDLGDDLDMVQWSAFYDMYQAVQQRLQILQGR
jgi:hypothetical protein